MTETLYAVVLPLLWLAIAAGIQSYRVKRWRKRAEDAEHELRFWRAYAAQEGLVVTIKPRGK